MPINFKKRERTDRIVVHKLRNQEDIGVKELDIKHRRLGGLSIGYHFVVRLNGDIEDGRDVLAVGGFDQNSVDICLLCQGDDPTEQQKTELAALILALLRDTPGAVVAYA